MPVMACACGTERFTKDPTGIIASRDNCGQRCFSQCSRMVAAFSRMLTDVDVQMLLAGFFGGRVEFLSRLAQTTCSVGVSQEHFAVMEHQSLFSKNHGSGRFAGSQGGQSPANAWAALGSSIGTPPIWSCSHPMEAHPKNLAGIWTPAKHIYIYILFAWLVENKGDPKKAKKEKGN